VHVATFWPEPVAVNGWAFVNWERGPHGRGVQIPQVIDLGDVVGFRAVVQPQLPAGPAPGGRPDPAAPPPNVRVIDWWGYLHAVERGALVLHGPHPTLHAAYAAAQQALAAQVWATDPTSPANGAGQNTAQPSPKDRAWREPAQPPVSVSLAWHGDTATVGDPRFGWLHVDSDDLAAALTLPSHELLHALRPLVPGLDGSEPPITLAALAALHLPDLPTIHTTAAPPPSAPMPEPPTPDPPPPVPTTGPAAPGPPTAAPPTSEPPTPDPPPDVPASGPSASDPPPATPTPGPSVVDLPPAVPDLDGP